MEITAKEILVKARKKISKPENWCQGVSARKKIRSVLYDYNDVFESCDAKDSEACQWCATGAIDSVTPIGLINQNRSEYLKAYRILFEHCAFTHVANFNDRGTTSHADILEAFDLAINAIGEF